MREVTIKLYQYHELSEKAKEKARQWYLEGDVFDIHWDFLKDDAKEIGLELRSWEYRRYLKASWLDSPYKVFKKIMENHRENCETYKTALEYKEKFEALPLDEEGQQIEDEDLEQDFLNALSEDYRILADKEYEYTQSDEYVTEAMESNEYEFLENGEMA